METKPLENKIDFAIIFSVKNANPNGDPLNGNRPRVDYEGYGEVSDVCLKRKIRDRLQENKLSIFVQSDEKKTDNCKSLKERYYAFLNPSKDTNKYNNMSQDEIKKKCCEKWFDVRAFGQVFAFKGKVKNQGVSISIRGPVTIQSAFSLKPIDITSTQITKSVSGEKNEGVNKSSDTMGMKYRVDDAVYVTYGAITPQLAERTGFNEDDAEEIKKVLPRLFEGDASSARPEGSMQVKYVVWWKHSCKLGQYPSIKVHNSLRDILQKNNGTFDQTELMAVFKDLTPKIIEGF